MYMKTEVIVYRCLFFLHTAAQDVRTCTHRMYGRKNTVPAQTYQQTDIKQYTAGLEFVRDRQPELTDAVGDCLRN